MAKHKGVGSSVLVVMNDLLGNRRCGARACNDDDKTWAESGSHSESKTGLSLYRSLNTKVYSGPGGRAQQLHLRYLFPSSSKLPS